MIILMLSEQEIQIQNNIYLHSVDYVKAYDKVSHEDGFEVLGKLIQERY